jgi:hypothetical protein
MLPPRVDNHDASAESDSSVDTWEASTDDEGPIGLDDYVPDEELQAGSTRLGEVPLL